MININDSYELNVNQLGGDGAEEWHSLETFGKDGRKNVEDFLSRHKIKFTRTWAGYHCFDFTCSQSMWRYIMGATQDGTLDANY